MEIRNSSFLGLISYNENCRYMGPVLNTAPPPSFSLLSILFLLLLPHCIEKIGHIHHTAQASLLSFFVFFLYRLIISEQEPSIPF